MSSTSRVEGKASKDLAVFEVPSSLQRAVRVPTRRGKRASSVDIADSDPSAGEKRKTHSSKRAKIGSQYAENAVPAETMVSFISSGSKAPSLKVAQKRVKATTTLAGGRGSHPDVPLAGSSSLSVVTENVTAGGRATGSSVSLVGSKTAVASHA